MVLWSCSALGDRAIRGSWRAQNYGFRWLSGDGQMKGCRRSLGFPVADVVDLEVWPTMRELERLYGSGFSDRWGKLMVGGMIWGEGFRDRRHEAAWSCVVYEWGFGEIRCGLGGGRSNWFWGIMHGSGPP